MRDVPDPVLAVAHDALDSQDALQLWSVFSKSKNSLQDGQRLENISWRLAFRDLHRQLPQGPWPPTPESVCSDDTKCISTTTCTPFFNIAPRKPMTAPARPAGRIIRDMIPPGLTQKLTQFQKETKKNEAYPTPASSSSSDSSGSASSSAVCIAVEPPAVQAEVEVPRVVVLTPTPNLTPHPTPPTTPLLAASAPPAPRTLAPPTPASPESTRRDPPGPLHLPRCITRGMGSPVFPPADSAHAPASQVSYAPQSTHILPLGGHDLVVPSSGNGHIAGPKTNGRGAGSKFYLAAHAGASSSRSSGSNDGDGPRSRSSASSSSSDSSRERSEAQSSFVHGPERGLANARGRGRGQIRNGGRRSSSEEEVEQAQAPPQPQPQQQKSPPEKLDQSSQPQAPQPPHTKPLQQPPQPQQKPPRAASAPFLGGIGLGLGMTPRTDEQVNGRQTASPAAMADADDSRSVSSLATSSSHVRMRRGKQPARTAMRSQHSRSRSRKGGTRVTGHGKEGSAPQFGVSGLPLPLTNLAAAAALVERNANSARQKVVVQTTDEEDGTEDGDEDGWTEDDSAEGTESVEVVEEEPEQEGDEEWEDEDSEIVEQSGPAVNAKAPPPSLQQQPPHPHLGHSRGHSTSGAATGGTDLRQLPNRPHRSAGHLPSLAHGGPAPAKYQHTTSAQNARTSRALKATMSATSLSSVMLEAQRQRELFAKAPRISYENLPQLATARPGGLTLLLGGGRQPQSGIAEQYHQQQQQLQQQNGGVPSLRSRPGGFGGLGLHMSSARPPPTGGAELSPIPPTPATANQQQQQQQRPAPRRQPPQQATAPSSPRQQPQPHPGPPPRRPGMARALSSSALPPHFGGTGTSGSLGKSSVAEPVVSVGGPSVLDGGKVPAAAVASGSTTTQSGSAGAGRSGGYRPKGPPAEMEYDDDDEESDADGRTKGRDDGQVSQSIAQERLRVFLSRGKTGSTNATNGVDAAEVERRRLYEQAGVVPWAAAANQHNVVPDSVAQPPPNRSMSTAPVGFPYNLPVPAPPSTPRTTRQQMLRNEMSESLRHNLLWQRKLSRTDTIGPQPRRTKSTVNVPSAAALAGQGGRQPEKSLVRVTPRAPGAERREALPPMDPPVPEGGPKKKLVRNLSWANTSDYHARGW